MSILTNVAPLYLSELVPAEYRARSIGLTVAASGAVSVIATVVVWAAEKLTTKWQYLAPLLVQAIFPAVLFFLSIFLTESPIWLLARGSTEKARVNMLALRAGNATLVDRELAIASAAMLAHQHMQDEDEDRPNVSPWQVFHPENLERTLFAAAPLCLSQVGGQILVGTYATVLLVQSGIADPFKITIVIFLLQFAGTLVGPFLLDKAGRRRTALPGFVLLTIIDFSAGAIACAGLATDGMRKGLAALCIIFAFINAVSFGSM